MVEMMIRTEWRLVEMIVTLEREICSLETGHTVLQ